MTPINTRQSLRARLDAYREEYLSAARRQDWDVCTRVNFEREPLFYELWQLEAGLPPEKRYWFPARVINQGQVFHPELTRKATWRGAATDAR